MMKINFSITYFIIGILIVLGFNYKTFYTPQTSNNTTSSTTTYVVEVGNIKNSIEVVGTAELVDEQNLTFNKQGTVTKVNFKEGDTIKRGDTIAEIDNKDAYASIDDAQISLENAKLNLKQLYEGATETQVLQSKNSITNAENTLETAKKELENLKVSQKNELDKLLMNINTTKKDLNSSISNLDLSKRDLEIFIKDKSNALDTTTTNKNSTIVNIEDSFKGNLVDAEKIIQDGDIIIGLTEQNRDKNDAYEAYLGAKDSSYKYNATSNLSDAISLYTNLELKINTYNYDGNKEDILSILNSFVDLYNKLYETSDNIYNTVDNSIVSVGALTDSQISSMKSNMSSDRSTSLSKVTSLKGQINSLNTLTDTDLLSETNDNSIATKQESIKSQELSIEKAKINLYNLQKSYEETVASQKVTLNSKVKDIESKQRSLEISKLDLEDLLEGPTDINVVKANNSIKQAQIKLDSAYESLDDYKLVAPFDGVVRKIDYMVGDNLSTDTSKYVYIENPNLLEISVMLDQIDIVSVKQGGNAIVTFDAYPNTPVNAIISNIDTTPVQSSGVVSYQVKIILNDDTFDKKILSGMTANIEIVTESKEDVLLLKSTAITEINNKKYVTLQSAGTEKQVEIETGISAGGLTEVVTGLNRGDVVLIKEYSSTSTSTSTSNNRSNSLLPIPGSGNSSFRQRNF